MNQLSKGLAALVLGLGVLSPGPDNCALSHETSPAAVKKDKGQDREANKNQNEYEAALKGRDFFELSEESQLRALGKLEDTDWGHIYRKSRTSHMYEVEDWDAEKRKWVYTEKYVPGYSKETEEQRWRRKRGVLSEALERQRIEFGVTLVLHYFFACHDACSDKK